MKKIKFFFIRNYQRFIRFLISFSAIGCILVSSFAVGAVTSFTPKVGAPVYVCVRSSSGDVFIATTDVPNQAVFRLGTNDIGLIYSSVFFSSPLPLCSSIDIKIPFSFSVPNDSYLQGSFSSSVRFTFSSSNIYSFSSVNLSLHALDGSIISVDYQIVGSKLVVSIPAIKNADFLEFSFVFSPPDINNNGPLSSFAVYFSNFDFTFGDSQEFASTNIFAFLDVIGSFFSCTVSFLSSCLAIIVASPALTVLCLAMPICGFSVLLLRRFIRT